MQFLVGGGRRSLCCLSARRAQPYRALTPFHVLLWWGKSFSLYLRLFFLCFERDQVISDCDQVRPTPSTFYLQVNYVLSQSSHSGDIHHIHTPKGCECKRCSSCFCWKALTPSWVHELIKNRRSLASLPPFCICLCSKPFSLQSFCNHLGFTKDRTDNIFMTMNWSHLELPPSQWGQLSQESSQTGARLLPPGDNFQNWTRPPAWPRLLYQLQLYLWLRLFNNAYLCPLSLVLGLFKPIAHVCSPEIDEDELSAYHVWSWRLSSAPFHLVSLMLK
jgi:hypothetical protein